MTRATRLCWPMAILLCLPFVFVLFSSDSSAGHDFPVRASASFRLSLESVADERKPPYVRPGLLFCVDGAGGFERASSTIGNTAAEIKLPLEVRSFHWTHGYCRIFSDEMHAAHLRKEGRKLADEVLSFRREARERAIYLMGHSAGCGVVLNAVENLPPNTLTRIVLLSPAVSSRHDLRPALRSSCQGIDVFISSNDWACLGLGTLLFGTTDRCWTARTAGKIGFQPIVGGPDDAVLYTKLRQYPWDPSMMCTGHNGGHYGSYQPGFLRAFVFPLFSGERPASAGGSAEPTG